MKSPSDRSGCLYPSPVNQRAPEFEDRWLWTPKGVRVRVLLGTEPNGLRTESMPWRHREGRLLSLLGVRKAVGFGEPLPAGVGNSARRSVDRRVARPNDASPPPYKTCGHRSCSRFAPSCLGPQGETGGLGSVPNPTGSRTLCGSLRVVNTPAPKTCQPEAPTAALTSARLTRFPSPLRALWLTPSGGCPVHRSGDRNLPPT